MSQPIRYLQWGKAELDQHTCVAVPQIVYPYWLQTLALLIRIVDIVDGAAYLFNKEAPSERRNLKAELGVEQYRHVLEHEQKKEVQEKENRKMD